MEALLGCLEMVHQTPGRLRYRIHSTTPIQWSELKRLLQARLDAVPLRWRLSAASSSVVLAYQSPDDGHQDGSDSAAAALRQGLQALLAALAASGAQSPAAPVIHIRVRSVPRAPLWMTPVAWLLNGITLGLSLLLLCLAGILLVFGVAGLMLPLSPGTALLMLATVLLELALSLRRPFVGPVSRA